jgi:hypothetical protein
MRPLLIPAILFVAALAPPAVRPATAGVYNTDCFGEPATIVSHEVGGTVSGTAGRDVIFTRFGSGRTIYAGAGDDLICAGLDDVVYAGSGHDSVYVYYASGAVYGESGHDYLFSTRSDLVSGGSGDDTIYGYYDLANAGDSGNDAFLGFGTDACDGGSGTDRAIANACDATVSVP